jgi:ankyrin repeat protein
MFLVDCAANTFGFVARPFGSHWIWTLRNCSIDDQINVLLAAGVNLSSLIHRNWYKRHFFDAIIEDKPIRLGVLLRGGVNIGGLLEWLTKDQVDALTQFSQLGAKRLLNESRLSPLCFAILYERSHMIESLLASGGSVDGDYPGRELAPIHFAAMLDSLESFKFLESNGADLSLADGKGRNMMYYLLNNDGRRAFDKSLLRYLVEHRNSYLRYSWSSNPAFMNRNVF